ncbi:MAG: asparagine synthase-related protein [Rhizomicrobium sp.]
MSAICLLWRWGGARDARPDAERMLSSLRIYGTHRQSAWSGGLVALGHALHRAVPEDAFDRQPTLVAEGTAVVAADARLDNRDDLVSSLGLSASDAAVLSDGGLLARAWERWGDACVSRLAGEFAFVVWDARAQRVFCARDPLGRRPLFYHRGHDFIAVASMPKGLFALPDIPRALNERLLGAYLAFLPSAGADNPFGGLSFYEGIERLAPGTALTLGRTTAKTARYWAPEHVAPVRYAKDADYLEHAAALFDRAVASCLRTTGPVGSHLSAGLDSSAVTVTAARLLAARGQRLTAFTAVPQPDAPAPLGKDRISDEGPLAAQTAAMFGNIDHVRVAYPHVSSLDPIARNLMAMDEPVRNPCNQAWADEISQQAQARGIRVMLTGEAGNITLSYDGLERFGALLMAGRLPSWGAEVIRFMAGAPWPRLRLALAYSLPSALRTDVMQRFGRRTLALEDRSPMSPRYIEEQGLDEKTAPALSAWHRARNGRGPRARMIAYGDPGTINLATLARFGFELRDPTADLRFTEFCLGIPLDQFFRRGETRRLARRLMRGALPDAVLAAQFRGLQGVGWLQNLRDSRAEALGELDRMRSSSLGARLLDLDELQRLAETIPEDGPRGMADVAAYRHKLLRGLAVSRFIRHVEGGNN